MSGDTLETLRTLLSARYRVERLLGSGGMATVYLAQDLKHDRPVAIKVLRPELAIALGPERFLREIQIAAKLNHPHILALHDSGDAGGLLYYVMPYVAGESLQEKVVREKQLSVEEALRITREVCAALAYAHGQGVIHRDIKPANILLSAGYALVADFGLARAISRASSSASITQPWLAVGTPNYMSPEQVSGEDELDGRSDIYSLGCVLYELLAGNPPFASSNPGSTLLRQRSLPPAPIRTVRPSVPGFVEGAISRALAKEPEERFQTAEEFREALVFGGLRLRTRKTSRWVTYGVLGLAAVGIGVGVHLVSRPSSPAPGSDVDTARYAVLPFEITGGLAGDLVIEQSVHDALGQWTGIKVADHFQIEDALVRDPPSGSLNVTEASKLSLAVGAGRYIRGEVSPSGDSLRIHAGLWDAATGRGLLGDATVKLGQDRTRTDSVIADLVSRLLLPSAGLGERSGLSGGSRSLPARRAFALGDARIREWDLEAADSSFVMALGHDPEYAQAALWLAQVRSWNNTPAPRWKFAAEKALAGRTRLTARDQTIAEALVAEANGEFGRACPLWRRLTVQEPYDFAGWYGLATCLLEDEAVIRDGRSPSRWRFRSSYHEAVNAYRRAFERLPSIHRAFRSGSYQRVRDLLFTRANRLRQGREGSTRFFAQASWAGDTLALIPYPANEFRSGLPGADPASLHEAVLHQRQLFRDIASAWSAADPRSADALEAVAISLEILGDPTALDTLRRARRLAQNDAERIRVGAAEVWLRMKLAIPDNLPGLRAALALADSLLLKTPSGSTEEPSVLAGLAALTGRVTLAAGLARRPGALGELDAPSAVVGSGPALWVFAAFGGPKDSLDALEREVDAAITRGMTAGAREATRLEWLARPATLAFPDYRSRTLPSLAGKGDALVDAELSLLGGDTSSVRHYLARIQTERAGMAPEDVTIDAVYTEARLLLLIESPKAAADWLDPALGSLRRVAPAILSDVILAGVLVRAMTFRAELAEQLGDRPSAARWARAVVVLWSGADPFLQPQVKRMTSLAG